MHNVAILTYQNQAFFELGCAIELFALPRPDYPDWYQTDIVSFDSGALNSTAGVQISAKQISSLQSYNMLIIPSWSTSQPAVPTFLAEQALALYQRGGRILSFCSGAFFLAELGLLNNKACSTHWQYAERFKRRYPAALYQDDVLYVYDGQIGCSAGSASALDMGLEVIRSDFGYQVANQVARRLVLPAHRNGGQSQFVETPIMPRTNQLSATLDWAIANLAEKLDVNTLASKANMSRRTFDRKFRASLNSTPKQWLLQQRLDLTRQLLEQTNNSIETIANQAGFENAIILRHHFRQRYQSSPRQYRQQFGRSANESPLSIHF